jgi:hypothetical protein
MNQEELHRSEVSKAYPDITIDKINIFLSNFSDRAASIVQDSENGENREIKLALLARQLGSRKGNDQILKFFSNPKQSWYAISNGRNGSEKEYHIIHDVELSIMQGSALVLPIFSEQDYAIKYYTEKQEQERLSTELKICKETLLDMCDVVGRKTNISLNPSGEPFFHLMIPAPIIERIAIDIGVRDVEKEWHQGEGAAIRRFKSQEKSNSLLDMDEDVLIEEMRGALTHASMLSQDFKDYFRIATVAYQRCPERARSDSGYLLVGQRASQNKRALRWSQDNLNDRPEDPLSHAYFALALLQIDPVGKRDVALHHVNVALRIEQDNYTANVLLNFINND